MQQKKHWTQIWLVDGVYYEVSVSFTGEHQDGFDLSFPRPGQVDEQHKINYLAKCTPCEVEDTNIPFPEIMSCGQLPPGKATLA